jgi:hypothetical protein
MLGEVQLRVACWCTRQEVDGQQYEAQRKFEARRPECAVQRSATSVRWAVLDGHNPAPLEGRSGAIQLKSLARLLKRLFEFALDHCPNCGGELKIIAAILEAPVIEKILAYLGLRARAPPRSPAREQALQAA